MAIYKIWKLRGYVPHDNSCLELKGATHPDRPHTLHWPQSLLLCVTSQHGSVGSHVTSSILTIHLLYTDVLLPALNLLPLL